MFIPFRLLLALILLALAAPTPADIVKPALVEISVYSEGRYRIEIRASIEALLTGIGPGSPRWISPFPATPRSRASV